MARRWTINGRFLSQPMTGVQRYAAEIVRALDLLIAQAHPLTRNLELQLVCPQGSAGIVLHSIKIRNAGRTSGHLWEQLYLPSTLGGGGLLSLCNTGPLICRKQIVCIHDANVWTAPSSYSAAFRQFYRILLPLLGRRVSHVSTVSAYSRSELVARKIMSLSNSFIAANGHEHALRWKPYPLATDQSEGVRNTILLVGSIAPHKNVTLVLKMADDLAQAGLRLIVVGAADRRVFRREIRREIWNETLKKAQNIDWVGRVSDDKMAALLKDALCLAFPSLTEGFGLPALEAMASGCPVIVSDRASLPEICGDAALYAAPDDPQAWFDNFVRLKNSDALRRQMSAAGLARSCAFSWRESALRYLEAMAEIDALGPVEAQNEARQLHEVPEPSQALPQWHGQNFPQKTARHCERKPEA